jgi:beta-1,4-mannosyltransferase
MRATGESLAGSASTPLVVLEVTNRPDGTTRYVDQVIADSAPDIAFRYVSLKSMLAPRLRVAHFHWPDAYVRAANPVASVVKAGAFWGFILFLRLRRVAIVRTLHNLTPHEGISRCGKAVLRMLDRQTTYWVAINAATPCPEPGTLIPHGHYRDRFAAHERATKVPARVLYAGLIRPYKGVERLIEISPEVRTPGFELRVVGRPTDALRDVVQDAVSSQTNVSAQLEFVQDAELVREMSEAQLVCLPYREVHNSGMTLVALSLDRPVLVPDSPTTASLAAEVGDEWVIRYSGALQAAAIEEALAATRWLGEAQCPLSSVRDWRHVGSSYARAFRVADQLARPRSALGTSVDPTETS